MVEGSETYKQTKPLSKSLISFKTPMRPHGGTVDPPACRRVVNLNEDI